MQHALPRWVTAMLSHNRVARILGFEIFSIQVFWALLVGRSSIECNSKNRKRSKIFITSILSVRITGVTDAGHLDLGRFHLSLYQIPEQGGLLVLFPRPRGETKGPTKLRNRSHTRAKGTASGRRGKRKD